MTDTPKIVGLDLSLTCTGVAGAGWSTHLKTPLRGHPRLKYLLEGVFEYASGADLVVIEGPSFGSGVAHRHEDLAGLRVMAGHGCFLRGLPYVKVPPANRAQYAAGKGNASKAEVHAAVTERYGVTMVGAGRFDEADAYTLCAMGYDWAGHPLATAPDRNRTALDKVVWPDTYLRAA